MNTIIRQWHTKEGVETELENTKFHLQRYLQLLLEWIRNLRTRLFQKEVALKQKCDRVASIGGSRNLNLGGGARYKFGGHGYKFVGTPMVKIKDFTIASNI